ncbi:response regulator receiver domain-containing protein [Yoonia maricola]|uniref:Response regulator receiver domain-containing protein n=1 Tax=Yoonia maricola TaxID=420999 RepID=A0A2M8WPY0_9RHOB|nr:response regulator [Yoonia maricola]PJI92990.1 response regulator receiver domain-containing protein [Yoonia maricola]
MRALIVHRNTDLGGLWQRHLARLDVDVTLVHSAACALTAIDDDPFDVILLDLVMAEGSAFAVADLARFRQPDANVVFVTDTTFFSDGSIFNHAANARALIETATPPKDLAAIVHHYGISRPARAVRHNPVPG